MTDAEIRTLNAELGFPEASADRWIHDIKSEHRQALRKNWRTSGEYTKVGSIDVADPADVSRAQDRGLRIDWDVYDGGSGSVAEPCCADVYEAVA